MDTAETTIGRIEALKAERQKLIESTDPEVTQGIAFINQRINELYEQARDDLEHAQIQLFVANNVQMSREIEYRNAKWRSWDLQREVEEAQRNLDETTRAFPQFQQRTRVPVKREEPAYERLDTQCRTCLAGLGAEEHEATKSRLKRKEPASESPYMTTKKPKIYPSSKSHKHEDTEECIWLATCDASLGPWSLLEMESRARGAKPRGYLRYPTWQHPTRTSSHEKVTEYTWLATCNRTACTWTML